MYDRDMSGGSTVIDQLVSDVAKERYFNAASDDDINLNSQLCER